MRTNSRYPQGASFAGSTIHKFGLVVALLAILTLNVVGEAHAQTGTPEVASVPTIPLYGQFEVQFSVDISNNNPYDPSQIDVIAQITTPDGKQVNVPAFYMQPYTQSCNQDCSVELLKPDGSAGWRLRYTPSQVGAYHFTVTARDTATVRTVTQGAFTVTPSSASGFIRVGKNHHYFAYDKGMPYFPVGPNLGWSWSGASGTPGYLNWLKKLHQVGANYARLYVDVPWFVGLDWRTPVGDYTSAQGDSWRLDTIVKAAEDQGIALQIVLLWSQGFTTFPGLPVNPPPGIARPNTNTDWTDNPYNIKNGGPLNAAAQFFSTDAGRLSFKRLLRYIVARWGYSTSVFSWEMIDQLDKVSTADPATASDWLRDMISYLRGVDPYSHLITAGVRDNSRASLLDSAVLDFKEVKFYERRPVENPPDQILGTLAALSPEVANGDRPVLMNEFSLNPWFEPTADDPTGVHVIQTTWAAALSGAGGGASSWWWDTYLFPQNLIPSFGPLAAFTKDIPWNIADLRPIGVSFGDTKLDYKPIRVTGFTGPYGGPKAPDMTFRLTDDGIVPSITLTSSYLYGVTYSTQLSQPLRLVVSPPVDTTFTVNVRRVSDKAKAKLVILIDGKTMGGVTFSPNSPPAGLSVPITAGEHSVVVDNLGDDFLQLDSIEVGAYIAPLRVIALGDQKAGLFLAIVQNRDYTWQNAARSIEAKPIMAALTVNAMPPGRYRLELWDPFTGNIIGQEDATIAGTTPGKLTIGLLPISKMIAVRAIRTAEPGNAPGPTPTLTETPRPLGPTPTKKGP
ncbi:MAG TPA: DUF5060 domain-containing protein [Aggregatilineales bacterium]|nr:DUF5060 domain-containing protein [Aggregatilineales bacterium]